MNPDTGHLVDLRAKRIGLTDRIDALPAGYEHVPRALNREAQKALAGHAATHVDLRSRGPLQNWAKKKRKAKLAAASRRRNRK